METTAETKLLGLIGHPVSHTLSPKLHSYFAQKTGKDTVYLAFDIEKQKLGEVISSAKNMGVLGFNITAPYKIDILSSVDCIDEEAMRMGSVNTIVNRGDKWYGYNTDGSGFVHSLELEIGSLHGKKVLLLGAGGTARSISYQFAKKEVASVTISARNLQNIDTIRNMLAEYTDCPFFDQMDMAEDYDIIVNTTPLGMHEHASENPFAAHMDKIRKNTVCCDLIYNPKKTLFLTEAQKRGAYIVNGLSMLVMQGIYAYELFTDTKLGTECFDEAMNLFTEFRI